MLFTPQTTNDIQPPSQPIMIFQEICVFIGYKINIFLEIMKLRVVYVISFISLISCQIFAYASMSERTKSEKGLYLYE